MDSSEDIVLEHCQDLLVNLLYSLAGRHLELYEVESCERENKHHVVSLIKYIQSKRGSLMWENEDPTPSSGPNFLVRHSYQRWCKAWLVLFSSRGIFVRLGVLKLLNGPWNAHHITWIADRTRYTAHYVLVLKVIAVYCF
jgi:hypothetical protein